MLIIIKDGLIIFFPGYSEDAEQFLNVLHNEYPKMTIKNAREWTFTKEDANAMFNNMDLSSKTLHKYRTRTVKGMIPVIMLIHALGPIIALLVNGPSAQTICKRAAETTTQNAESYFLPSTDEEKNHIMKYIFLIHKKSM